MVFLVTVWTETFIFAPAPRFSIEAILPSSSIIPVNIYRHFQTHRAEKQLELKGWHF
jgi:hypothetical protein